MKTKSIIIAALALITIVPAALAQEKIKKVFESFANYDCATQMGEQNTSNVDSAGVTNESRVLFIKVKEDCLHYLFTQMKNAFDEESHNASMYNSHTGDDAMTGDNTNLRQQWSVWRDGASPILVGSVKNSSYLIANFDDQQHPGYRSCYAVEWSDADIPTVHMAKLVYVYGRKPEAKTNQNIQYYGTATWPGSSLDGTQLPSDLQKRIGELQNMPDSMYKTTIDRLPDNIFGFAWPNANNMISGSRDIPYDGNKDAWIGKAMNNVKHLSNSDWHRFFGLLTSKMMEQANRLDKYAKEDLVVSAGIILDLCKNAYQLDDDECEVSAKRLQQVANALKSNSYVYDLLMLGAKKLRKK